MTKLNYKKRKKPQTRRIPFYIHGDDELRTLIFNAPSCSQQAVFELFASLDEYYSLFFLYYAAIPSNGGLWEFLASMLAAQASGTSRKRNFCEDYSCLDDVTEIESKYDSLSDKALDVVGCSHAFWWEMSDPQYETKPNTLELWKSVLELAPVRMVWEWWFDTKCKELRVLKEDCKNASIYEYDAAIEDWMEVNMGISFPRTHGYMLMEMMLFTEDRVVETKHRIATPFLRLAYSITKSIAARNQSDQFFDTFNIACGGLMRAISRYAASQSMAFANFAYSEIRYEIFYQIGNYNLVNLPNRLWQTYRELENYKAAYIKKYGKTPSLVELADTYRLDRQKVFDIYYQVGIQKPKSLDELVYPEEDSTRPTTLKDRLEDLQEKETKRITEYSELLLLALNKMPSRQRKLFGLTYNLCDLLQEIQPDPVELHNFFYSHSHVTLCK